jgi:hypothetical protein
MEALRTAGFRPAVLTDNDIVEGRLSGWEGVDGAVTSFSVTHGRPRAGAPFAVVETSRWSGARAGPGPLPDRLARQMRLHGEVTDAIAWREEAVTLTVDGRERTGARVRASERWWTASCRLDEDVEVAVFALDWPAEFLTLATDRDAERLLAETDAAPGADAAEPADPRTAREIPGAASGDPLRRLVDETLTVSRETATWRTSGGPTPQPRAGWAELWRAAVARQMELTGQAEGPAEEAVQAMTGQLGNLRHQVDWFEGDERLRERAIGETMLFWTDLSTDVASRPAQHAWRRLRALADDVSPAERAAAAREWLDAWAVWASDHGTSTGAG